MLIRAVVVALLTGFTVPALAVNKCTKGDGTVVYQDGPCVAATAERVNLSGAGEAQPGSAGAQYWQRESARQTRSAAIDRAIANGQIVIGMTADEAVRAWGQPTKVNSTTTQAGRSEQWVYRRGQLGAQYVYVDAGRVRSVQTQE